MEHKNVINLNKSVQNSVPSIRKNIVITRPSQRRTSNTKSDIHNKSYQKTLTKSLSESFLYSIPKFESSNTLRNSIHNVVFSKDKRFHKLPPSSSTAQFYNLPSLTNTRAAGIGFGNKNNFLPLLKTPAPCAYKIKSCFEISREKNKGISLTSRSSSVEPSKKLKTPGPSDYFKPLDWLDPTKGVTIVSRHGFYYDDYLKGRSEVSPVSYKLNFSQIESGRYKVIGIGGTGHEKAKIKDTNPGVGSYNLPSCFDQSKKRGYVLN